MIKNLFCIVYAVIALSFTLSTVCFAGSAPITVINVKSNIKAVKYEFRYGTDKKDDPSQYSNYTFVNLNTPVLGGTTCEVEFIGSGDFYVSVKDYYIDGSTSEYSEPFKINNVPDKVTHPSVK